MIVMKDDFIVFDKCNCSIQGVCCKRIEEGLENLEVGVDQIFEAEFI